MPEWNEMEDFKNGMEDNLLYFHTNSILDFAFGIYKKVHATTDKKYFHRSFWQLIIGPQLVVIWSCASRKQYRYCIIAFYVHSNLQHWC